MAEHALGVVCTGLMETVHVQLSDEAVDLVVAEVAREDNLLELVDVFDDELNARWRPVCDFIELFVLGKITCTFKISKVFAIKPATSVAYTQSSQRDDMRTPSILTLYF